ncbi:MAG TPA: CDP-glycerol glycerophosphotransferase family protein, partial [Brevibacterium sp.]|nr:CDP-glycerol glycerophosphotransferase family protein [Brevibacterium sp.]
MPDTMRPRADDGFIAGVHFAGDEDSTYQLEQWLRPLEGLSAHLRDEFGVPRPLGILCRSADHALTIAELTDLPVRFSRLSAGLTTFMSQSDLRIVFYVNQSMKNFQALRFPGPAHIHLSHGESEKVSMISNQLKAYDWVFTAGPAARERISQRLIGMPETRMMDIGRPQLDEPRRTPAAWTSSSAAREAGPLVFVAPTWEGDSPGMAYGTVDRSGVSLLSSLFDAGFRVLYRPHPRTGVVSPAARRARQDCERLVESRAGGFLDTTAGVGWQLDVADAAVCEMSSVAFDWLATGRPLLMLRPADPRAEVIDGGLFDRARSLEADEAAEAGTVLRDVLADPAQARALADEL